jgi:Transposase IS200 like
MPAVAPWSARSRRNATSITIAPPHIAVSDFVRRVKGRSSHRVQMEFPELRKRYWVAISGREATSALPAATSQTRLYFSISSIMNYRRQPVVIQLLAGTTTAAARLEADEAAKSAKNEIWLGDLQSY